jgi:hypothetical protein
MRFSAALLPLLPLALVVACGGSDPQPIGDDTAYTSDPDKTVVIGGDGTAVAQPSSGCVTLPSGECVEAKSCKPGERRDVVLDSAGKVVAVVCYPADPNPPTIDDDGNVTLDKNQNNGVVAVGDIGGNVEAQGNNVTVYGQGPEVSIVRGNVVAEGNNFSLRGVTVLGNVEVSGGNNATLVLCVVEGDVKITGNNNVIADCTVHGNIEIDGVNNVIVGNRVGGTIVVTDAKNSVCDGNVKWVDANGDKIVDPGELGDALACE